MKKGKVVLDLRGDTYEKENPIGWDSLEILKENAMKVVTKDYIYMGNNSGAPFYQYKLMKMQDFDLKEERVREIFSGNRKEFLDGVNLESLIKQVMKSVILFDKVKMQGENISIRLHNAEYSMKRQAEDLRRKIGLDTLKLSSIESDFISKNFYPRINQFSEQDMSQFKEWFEGLAHDELETGMTEREKLEGKKPRYENPKEACIFYHYASTVTKNPNLLSDPRLFLNDPVLQEGTRLLRIDSVALYIYQLFRRIENPKYELNRHKRPEKYDRIYNLFADTFLNSGLLYSIEENSSNIFLLKLFYYFLDLSPDFRNHCLKKLIPAYQYMTDPAQNGRQEFRAEIDFLERDPAKNKSHLIKDLVMLLLMEFDITSDLFVYTLNLLDYLAKTNTDKFGYLGIFLGDFYDDQVFGQKGLENEKRTSYYNIAWSFDENRCDSSSMETFSFKAKMRLSVLLHNELDKQIRFEGKKQEKRETFNTKLTELYKKCYGVTSTLLIHKVPHSIYLFAIHHIKAHQPKIQQGELSKIEDYDLPRTINLSRQMMISRALKYMKIIFLLGADEKDYLVYFGLLRYLKDPIMYQVSLKTASFGLLSMDLRNNFEPLAYCKEKGIGGVADLDFAIEIYRSTINAYFQSNKAPNTFKIGLMLYRLGLVCKRGGAVDIAEEYFRHALKLFLTCKEAYAPSKQFLYQLAVLISKLKVQFEGKSEYIEKFLRYSYQIYPSEIEGYFLHYECEKKLNNLMNQCGSIEDMDSQSKPGMSGKKDKKPKGESVITLEQTFYDEIENRRGSKDKANAAKADIQRLGLGASKLLNWRYGTEYAQPKKSELNLELTALLSKMPRAQDLQLPVRFIWNSSKELRDDRYTEILKKKKEAEEKSVGDLISDQNYRILKTVIETGLHIKEIREAGDGQAGDVLIDREVGIYAKDKSIRVDFGGKPIYPGHFVSNQQMLRCFEFTFDNSTTDISRLFKNFDYFLTYNPFLLNYYGVKYEISGLKDKIKIFLYSEYFESIGTTQTGKPYWHLGEEKDSIPLNHLMKIGYQLLHAVRSHHIIGKVCYFIHDKFFGFNQRSNLKLIVPFYENYFSDPATFILDPKRPLEDMNFFAPEVFFDLEKLQLKASYFEVLDPKHRNEVFRMCSGTDIWALAIFFYQIFTNKEFYSKDQFNSKEEFMKFIVDRRKVEAFVKSKLKGIPKMNKGFKDVLKKMFDFDPRNRPTIHKILREFEYFVFSSSFELNPYTQAELNRLMYKNALFSREEIISLKGIENLRKSRDIYLPKNYVYKGETLEGIPHGFGEIVYNGKVVVQGHFNRGEFEEGGDVTFKLSSNNSVELKKMNSKGYPLMAQISGDAESPEETKGSVGTFLENSCIPELSFFTERFKDIFERKIDKKGDRSKIQPFSKDKSREGSVESKRDYREEEKSSGKKEDYWETILGPLKEFLARTKKEKNSLKSKNEIKEKLKLAWLSTPMSKEVVEVNESLLEKGYTKIQKEIGHYMNFVVQNNSMFDSTGIYKENIPLPAFSDDINSNSEDDEDDEEEEEEEDEEEEKKKQEMYRKQQERDLLQPDNSKTPSQPKEIVVERYYSNFLDIFGTIHKLDYDRKNGKVYYGSGLIMTHLETYKKLQVSVYCPLVDSNQLFISRVSNFALVELARMNSFEAINKSMLSMTFSSCIVVDNSSKHYRGSLKNGEIEIGLLYLMNKKYVNFKAGSGKSFNGSVVDNTVESLEYDGSLWMVEPSGLGTVKLGDTTIYEGRFYKGLPHGKGIFRDRSGETLFQGVFKDGWRRFGTTITSVPNKNVLEGIVHMLDKPPMNGLNDFFKYNEENLTNCVTEGSIRFRGEPSIMYTKFSGQERGNLTGPAKILYDKGGWFFGYFLYGERSGKGILVDSRKNTVAGIWTRDFMQGSVYWNTDQETEQVQEKPLKKSKGHVAIDKNGSMALMKHGEIIYQLKGDSEVNDVYVGEIELDLPHGFGRLSYGNGDWYEGEFSKGKMNGIGIYYRKEVDSMTYGNFKDDKANGYGVFVKEEGLKNPYQLLKSKARQRGYFECGELKSMYLSRPEKLMINGLYLEGLYCQAEYNSFEGTYIMKGFCYADFYKLVSAERSKISVLQRIFDLMLLLLNQKHLIYVFLSTVLRKLLFAFTEDEFTTFRGSQFDELAKSCFEACAQQPIVMKEYSENERLRIPMEVAKLYSDKKTDLRRVAQSILQGLKQIMSKPEVKQYLSIFLCLPQSGLQQDETNKLLRDIQLVSGSILKEMNYDIQSTGGRVRENQHLQELELNKRMSAGMSQRKLLRGNSNVSDEMMDKIERKKSSNKKVESPTQSPSPSPSPDKRNRMSLRTRASIRKEMSPGKMFPGRMSMHNNRMSLLGSQAVLVEEEEEEEISHVSMDDNWSVLPDTLKLANDIIYSVDDLSPDFYSGEIFNDEISGAGLIQKKETIIYEGEFQDFQISGLGRMRLEAGVEYEGTFVKMVPNGIGAVVKGQERQEGEFKARKREGVIIVKVKGKEVAVGRYAGNLKNGVTVRYRSDGQVLVQNLVDGELRHSVTVERDMFLKVSK
jgi:hypothetical protein